MIAGDADLDPRNAAANALAAFNGPLI